MNKRLIGYTRVSTSMQHESGGGLQAQEYMIRNFCKENNFFLLDIYIEAHSGADNDRPVLKKVIQACQEQGANIIVAKIDRLSRRMSFITSFKENFGIDFYVANLGLEINKTMLYLLVIFAELERDMISKRVKDGIAQKKREGTYKKPPGRKDLWKDGKGLQVRKEKSKKHRTQIFKELEFIYKRYQEKELDDRKEPSSQYYITALNDRGNRTFTGKEWSNASFNYLLKSYACEIENFSFKTEK